MRGYALGLVAALISQGAAAEWTVNAGDLTAIVIERAADRGSGSIRITCQRSALLVAFTFSGDMAATGDALLRTQADGEMPELSPGQIAGSTVTITKPYAYALLLRLTQKERVTVQPMVPDGPAASFKLAGLKTLTDRYDDLCFFGPPAPRA